MTLDLPKEAFLSSQEERQREEMATCPTVLFSCLPMPSPRVGCRQMRQESSAVHLTPTFGLCSFQRQQQEGVSEAEGQERGQPAAQLHQAAISWACDKANRRFTQAQM